MDRNLYSYWFKASQRDGVKDKEAAANALLKYLRATELAEDLVFEIDSRDYSISGEVNPEYSTIYQTDYIYSEVEKAAVLFKDTYDFRLDENDEEDHSNKLVSVWADGSLVSALHARTLDPDKYDDKTTDAIVWFLKEQGHDNIADAVKKRFKNRSLHGGVD